MDVWWTGWMHVPIVYLRNKKKKIINILFIFLVKVSLQVSLMGYRKTPSTKHFLYSFLWVTKYSVHDGKLCWQNNSAFWLCFSFFHLTKQTHQKARYLSFFFAMIKGVAACISEVCAPVQLLLHSAPFCMTAHCRCTVAFWLISLWMQIQQEAYWGN